MASVKERQTREYFQEFRPVRVPPQGGPVSRLPDLRADSAGVQYRFVFRGNVTLKRRITHWLRFLSFGTNDIIGKDSEFFNDISEIGSETTISRAHNGAEVPADSWVMGRNLRYRYLHCSSLVMSKPE